MSKPDTWMPLYVADYLADTLHLTRDEHGAYLLLMMAYWRNGGPLMDDDKRLAATVKASPKEWKDIRPTLEEFFTVAGGEWIHKRIDMEIERAQGMVDQRSAAGKASAEKRKKEREAEQLGNENSNGNSTTVERPLQRDPQRNGKPSPSPIPLNPLIAAALPIEPEVGAAQPVAAASDAAGCRAAEIVALLKPRGVMTHSANPIVRRWAGLGVQDVQLLQALQTAENRRSERGSPQPVNVGLLNAILVELMADPPQATPGRPRTTAELRTVAATTRLTDFLNDDGTPKAAEQRSTDDDRTINANTPRLVG